MRQLTVAVCAVVSVILLSGCQMTPLIGVDDIFPGDLDEVDRIVILDGATGESREQVDPEGIREIVGVLRDVRWESSADQRLRTGFALYTDFYRAGRHIARLTLWERRAALTGEYYDLDDALNLRVLQDLFSP